MQDNIKQTHEVMAKRTAKNSVFLDLFQQKQESENADIDIEVKAKVIYESDMDDIINQYIIFCKVFNVQTKQYGMTRKAVTETIRK